ncbi:dTMP kinase [Gordonia sp. NPDC003425]
MGVLIAVEGLDGAGKNTLVTGLVDHLRREAVSVSTFTFPRYDRSLTADIAAQALHGEHGDMRDSVYGMALLFALDRFDANEEIRAACYDSDVVILDRYVASNAAYSAARLHQHADGEVVRWVSDLEFGRFRLPTPDHHILLGVSPDVAMNRARKRESADPGRTRDAYETDTALQLRVHDVYRELAAAGWVSPWIEIGNTSPEPEDLARRLMIG